MAKKHPAKPTTRATAQLEHDDPADRNADLEHDQADDQPADLTAGPPRPTVGPPLADCPEKAPTVDAPRSACVQCGSRDRTPYHNTRRIESAGVDRDGLPYSAIVLRYTKCVACGQLRIDRSHE